MSTPNLTFSSQGTEPIFIPPNTISQRTKPIFHSPKCNIPGNRAKVPPSHPPSHTSAQPNTTNIQAYRHKLTKLPPATIAALLKKKPKGCAEGARLCGPFAVFIFLKKNTAPRSPKTKHSIFQKNFSKILLLYLTTRTLYIPSISLSSSSAFAEAALSRSIRV